MESAINTFFYSLFTMIACGILLSCCPCLMPLIILVESFHYLQLCIKKLQSSFTSFFLLLVNVSSSMYNTVLGRKGGTVMAGGWLGDELWVNDVVFKKSALPIQNTYQADEPLPIPKPPSQFSQDTPFIVEKPLRSRTAKKVTVERLHELLIKALRRRDGELWVIEPRKAKDKVEEKQISNPSIQAKAIHKAEVFKKEKSNPVIAAKEGMGDSAVKEAQQLISQERKEEVVLSQNVTAIEHLPVQPSTISHRLFRLRPRRNEYRFLPYNLSCWFKDRALYRKQKLHNTAAESLIYPVTDGSESSFKTYEIATISSCIDNSLNYVVTEASETVFLNANPEPHRSNPSDSTTELQNPKTTEFHQVDPLSIISKDITTPNITEATQGKPVNANSPTNFEITNRYECESSFVKMETSENELKSKNSPTHDISQYHQADTETTILMPSEPDIKNNYSGNNLVITKFSKADDAEVDPQNPDPTHNSPIDVEVTSSESHKGHLSDAFQEDTYSSNAELLNFDSASINTYTLQVSFNDIETSALVFVESTVPTLKNEEANHSVGDISTTVFTSRTSESKTMGVYHSIAENHFSQTLDEAKSAHNIPGTSENTETQVVPAEYSPAETPNIESFSANRPISETEIQYSPSDNYITTNEPSQNEIEIACPAIPDYHFSTSGDATIGGPEDNVDASTPNISLHNPIENDTLNTGYHNHSMSINNSEGTTLVSTNPATYHDTPIINDTRYFFPPNANSNIPFLIPNTSTISTLSSSIQSTDVSTIQLGGFQQPLPWSHHTVLPNAAPFTPGSLDINMEDTGFYTIQQAQPHFYNSAPQMTTFSETNNPQNQTTDTDTTMDFPQVSAGQGLSVVTGHDGDHFMADDATVQSGSIRVQQETDEEMAETFGEETIVANKAMGNAGAERRDEDMAEVEDAPGNLVNNHLPEMLVSGMGASLSSAQGPSLQQTPSTPSPSAIQLATTSIHPSISTPTATSATSPPFTASLFVGPPTPKNSAPAASLSTPTQKKRGRSDETASTPTTATTLRVIAPLRGAPPTLFTPEVAVNEAEDEEEDWDAWSEEDEADFPDGEITEEQEAQARAYEEAMLQEEEEDREYDRLFALHNKSQDGKRARQRRE